MYRVTACIPGTPGPTWLSVRQDYDYWYRGADPEPFPGEPSPREIVARLHAEIAAKSPGRARLVAEFERITGESRAVKEKRPTAAVEDRRARIQEYGQLQASGLSNKAVSRVMGIHDRTGREYRAAIRRGELDD